ncbi:MAG: terpene cyclase/mutase family protein [Candidatus Marinimicrobia bacterium]|nr:terpene cyclase/mutase family protein [Candidatus Neomarinimicrobiota bacterium]
MEYEKRMQQILDHVWGPTGSIILHILLVMALVRYVVFDTKEAIPDIEVYMVEPDAQDLEEFEQELELLEDLPEVVDAITPPEINMQMDAPPEVADFAAPQPDVDFAALDVVSDMPSPLVMRGLFAGRSAGGRASMLREHAGKLGEHTERAVIRALQWLKENQNKQGTWAGPNPVAMAGLGLLTFLAHGETPSSEEYGPTVERAMRYLVSQQQGNGGFGNAITQHGVYAHGMAAYAISEAYGMTRIPSLKPVMDKAIELIVKGQQGGGSWDYAYKPGPRWDTSVAGWQIQAIKAAYLAGSEVPGLEEAMQRAIRGIEHSYVAERMRFGYSSPGSGSIAIQGIGVLCLQLLGRGTSEPVRGGLTALQDEDCVWEKPPNWALYAWYYITQAKFHQGGRTWSDWNSRFARTLVQSQNSDGSWIPPGTAFRDGTGHGNERYGPAYGTTFAALMLQVYYRFLPTYKPIEVETRPETDPDDIQIEII